jgi:hypothetical protein
VTTDLKANTPIRCPHYHSLLSMIKVLLQTVQCKSVLIIHTEIQPIFTSSAQSMTSRVAENNTSVVPQTRWKRKYTFQKERIQPNFSTTLSKLLIKLWHNRLNPKNISLIFNELSNKNIIRAQILNNRTVLVGALKPLQSLQFVLLYIRS